MDKSVQIKIIGKVQGVGFRYHTCKHAKQLDVKGFVKNLTNGTVYVEAEGEKSALELFCDWCKHGPEWARVDSIQICEVNLKGFDSFEIR